ncbi:MAG: ABC transporter permease [Blastopirellula sp.]|nr:MAG: ABC transporter permease [Blastopirellula sp.]
MYLLENPVLQRELLVNLRTARSFLLLLLYQVLLAAIVYFAWPQVDRWDPSQSHDEALKLFDLFFLGQFILASMMAPSFAAGALTGEKERKTYEMLLASPLKPGAIVIGKLFASLAHLALLIFTSLPIVMLCLPLGGISLWEVLCAYFILILAVITFGMISIACSSFFQRTSASLVVSYLIILPIALIGAMFWQFLQSAGVVRLIFLMVTVPIGSGIIVTLLFYGTAWRLLYPSDMGSEGKEVVDLDKEAEEAVGLVIQRDQFPDKLFAPAKRTKLLADNVNPVYDKEIHSEIFAQGTLMLRVVIQVSMFLAIPLMAICLYIFPQYAPYYISYVILFNMLVGPVFSAGSITSERERETLDLLLTTEITPWQILSGKFLAGLRVSSVLTMFLLWPMLLACVMVSFYWTNWLSVVGYLATVLLTCVSTGMIALFCSVTFRKTAHSLMGTYLILMALFCGPLAFDYFAQLAFSQSDAPIEVVAVVPGQTPGTAVVEKTLPIQIAEKLKLISPFAATVNIPMTFEMNNIGDIEGSWKDYLTYVGITITMNIVLFIVMTGLFHSRWRVAS